MNSKLLPDWRAIPILLYLFALTLRLIRIGQESFFIDEVGTLTALRGDTWQAVMTHEANPPLYFYLLKLWTVFFGHSHESLRALSAFGGSFAPPLLYAALRKMGLRLPASLTAGLCLALSPLAVWYGQQARGYALLVTIICGWLYLIARAALERSPALFVGQIVLLALGISIHYFFPLAVIGGIGVAMGSYLARRSAPNLRQLALANGIGMLTWVFYVPLFTTQVLRHPGQWDVSWIPHPTWKDLAQVFGEVFVLGPWNAPTRKTFVLVCGLFVVLPVTVAALLTAASQKRDRNPETAILPWGTFLFTSAVLPVAVMFILSQGERSIFIKDRYTITGLPGFIGFTFYVIDRLPWRWFRTACLAAAGGALAGIGLLSDLRYWTRYQEFDWRGAARTVEAEWREGDAALFLPGWMLATFTNNSRSPPRRVAPPQALALPQALEPLKEDRPSRIWLFTWEQNPDVEEARLAGRLCQRRGARLRVDFPHIRMWEIPD